MTRTSVSTYGVSVRGIYWDVITWAELNRLHGQKKMTESRINRESEPRRNQIFLVAPQDILFLGKHFSSL